MAMVGDREASASRVRLRLPWSLRSRLGLQPDFIIVGVQRGGTSSLYRYLTQHPCVKTAVRKEVHFFDLNYQRGIAWYRAQFPSSVDWWYARMVQGRRFVTGEASPSYLFHPAALRRMRQMVPHAKLVLLLRNPVDRAYSHYHHEVKHGREPLTFEEALNAEPGRLAGEWERMSADERYQSAAYQCHSYLARGRYLEQLERLEAFFPSDQLLIVRSEDFFGDPARTFRRVVAFLNLPAWEPHRFERYNVGHYQSMSLQTRKRLAAYFKPYNQRLSNHLGIDFRWD